MGFTDDALEILGDAWSNPDVLVFIEGHARNLVPFVGAGLSVPFGYPSWSDLLRKVANTMQMRPEVDAFLDNNQFEEAAEVLVKRAPNAFDDAIRTTFDDRSLPRPLGEGAVRFLPYISSGPVVTTNFDRVLEAAFEDAGCPFQDVFPGSHIRSATRSLQLNERFLLKLHGDHRDPADRVLTLAEYRREYGNESQSVDLALPLPTVLGQIFGARPLLFLGCSLNDDRTTRVIAQIAARLPGTIHVALLPASENTASRRTQLDSWNIRPLFFPNGKYEAISHFLKILADLPRAVVELAQHTSGPPAATMLPPASAPGPAQVHQLRRSPPDFVGREVELEHLQSAIQRGTNIIGITGLPGIGKTTLSLKLAEMVIDSYPDGQFFINLHGDHQRHLSAGDVMREVVVACDRLAPVNADLEGRYRSVLYGQRVLLLLTNVHDEDQLSELTPPASCLLLYTATRDLALPGTYRIRLDALTPESARAFVTLTAPDVGICAGEIAELCGGYPFALRMAVTTIAMRNDLTPQQHLRLLSDSRRRLEIVSSTLNLAYQRLPPEAQTFLCRLSVFPSSFDLDAVVATQAMDIFDGIRTIGILLSTGFVAWDPNRSRYYLHEIIRFFADSHSNDAARVVTRKLHGEHYLGIAKTCDHLYLTGGASTFRGLGLFDMEWKNIDAALRNALAAPNTADANRFTALLPDVAWYCLRLRRPLAEQKQLLENALAAARGSGDRVLEASHLAKLGSVMRALGDATAAIQRYQAAIEQAEHLGDKLAQGRLYGNLANVLTEEGMAHIGLGYSIRALRISRSVRRLSGVEMRRVNAHRSEMAAWSSFGAAAARLGRIRAALNAYKRATALADELGDQPALCRLLVATGDLYRQRHDNRVSVDYYRRASCLAQAVHDDYAWQKAESGLRQILGDAADCLALPADLEAQPSAMCSDKRAVCDEVAVFQLPESLSGEDY